MKSYTSNKTEVRKSEKQGFGFFAVSDIKKDEVLAIRSGHIVEFGEALKLDAEVGDLDSHSMPFEDDSSSAADAGSMSRLGERLGLVVAEPAIPAEPLD